MEDEEYNYREVKLPSLIPVAPEPELERETGERRRGRDVIIAIDHGPNSKHAFDWTLVHFCRLADTIHLVHAVTGFFLCFFHMFFPFNLETNYHHLFFYFYFFSDLKNQILYDTSQGLMEKLAVEAFQVAMVCISSSF